MLLDFLVLILVLAAVGVAVLSWRALYNRSWILGWLRGNLGLLLLGVTAWLAALGWDVASYRSLTPETTLATFQFEQVAEQQFRVTMVDHQGGQRHFDLQGDQWQVDARVLQWRGAGAGLLFKSGYRLNEVKGRFYSLSEDRQVRHSDISLSHSRWRVVDVWAWLHSHPDLQPWLTATYANPVFVPMTDAALYEVRMVAEGLVIRPLNDSAQGAVERRTETLL